MYYVSNPRRDLDVKLSVHLMSLTLSLNINLFQAFQVITCTYIIHEGESDAAEFYAAAHSRESKY